jgi:hypothetical protein
MAKKSKFASNVHLSIRLYKALISIYPAEFRQDYGGPMVQVFRDCCRQTYWEAGMSGLLLLWWRTIFDTVKTAIEEHSQRGVNMSKQTFIKLSGWALILSGISLVFGNLAESRPVYDPYNMESLFIDQYANVTALPLIVAGFLLLSTGLLGIFLRYGDRASSFGRYSLGASIALGFVNIMSFILMSANVADFWWDILVVGVIIQFLGITFLGIDALRQCILPRWNGLPLLAGVWIPLLLITDIFVELVSGVSIYSQVWSEILLILTLVGLFGLGIVLETDAQPANAALPST